MKEQVGNVIIDYSKYLGVDSYSDGDIESEILDIVKRHTEEEFNQIIEERGNWAVLYHLSHIRGNIVEWLPISKEQTVLEIGAGCGAITGVLSKKSKKVTCIELSKQRSLINAHRNKEKSNIEILVGNFQDIEKELTEKYDYITLIGVYEYAENYIVSSNPYVDFLKQIAKHLKSNGRIIIAIENRMGLKYWAGCQEDHFGGYFENLEDYPNTQGVKTFTKRELEGLIEESGLGVNKFYYPYPDYKLPMSIYSDEYLPNTGDLNINMQNFDRERVILFDETKVYDTIITEQLFPIYSNSYLVIIQKEEK